MSPAELEEIGAEIVLGNTFHLWLRPGLDVIAAHEGLHRFMGWRKPILTDSGGFQVFSLGELRKISEEGVRFASPINGDRLLLTPEESIRIQRTLDSDIAMVFDECTPFPATEREAADSMRLSLRWAERSKREWERGGARRETRCSASCRAASTTSCATSRSPDSSRSASTATRSAASRSASRRRRCCASSSGPRRGCPPTGPATSWASARPRTSSRRWRPGSTCSTACSRPATRATAGSSPAGATSASATPATATTRGRSTRPAAATRAGTSRSPTSTTCSARTRSSARASPPSTTSTTT